MKTKDEIKKWNKYITSILEAPISSKPKSCVGLLCKDCILDIRLTSYHKFLCLVCVRSWFTDE